jgi:hypothetical protein
VSFVVTCNALDQVPVARHHEGHEGHEEKAKNTSSGGWTPLRAEASLKVETSLKLA